MNKLRKLNTILLVVLALVMVLAIAVACGDNETPETPKKDITGVTFENKTVTYDGNEHKITVSGTIPEGVNVSYTNNKGTDTGTYNATATLTGEGYNTLTLNATLTIDGQDITGITLADTTVPYDKEAHSLTIAGELPAGVTVSYTYNGQAVSSVSNYGEYTVKATLAGTGYNTLTLTATLTIEAKDITGATFNGDEVTYDGSEHTIDNIVGLPDGVEVISITGNKGTDAGTYDATAEVWGVGYKPATLTATLIINKATISQANLTFENSTVEYDAKQHSIVVVGNTPTGVTITYFYDGEEATSIAYPGEHEVLAVLSGKNHNELTLTATLTITSHEEMLYSAVYGSYVYFQNSLDGNRLYRATGTGSSLAKVSNDVATYFTSNGTSLYFYSASLFTQTIKALSTGTSGTKLETVFNPGRATYLASDSNGNIYYAKANLVDSKNENGIYKVNVDSKTNSSDTDEIEMTAVRLTTDKADFIAYYNGYIYYCNNSDGSKLYRIAVTANNGTGQKLTDNKVSDIVVADGAVYYTLHKTLSLAGSSIQKYTISSGTTTDLCIDNGAYLTKVGNYIYYVNKDKLTSNVFGKGIYRVSINGGTTVGEKVIDAEETGDCYYSLSGDATYLYYYKMSDKHFYRYNVQTKAETDLMVNFVPTETTTISASPYAHLATYKGEVYYTDVLDTNSLYKYNPDTNATFKVLSDSVSNVFFHEDYMYYSTYIFTNYALWKLDMTNPEAEPVKISSHRYENLIFVDNDIYAIRVMPPLSYKNRIVKLTPPTETDTELYTETIVYFKRNLWVAKLYLYNDKFHFTINPVTFGVSDNIFTHDFDSTDVEQREYLDVTANNFVIYNDTYYYYNHKKNTFCNIALSGGKESVIEQKVEITDMFEYNGIVYYTSISSQNTGIYAYNTSTGETTQITTKVGHGFHVLNGKIYFINIALTLTTDYPQYKSGDGHLYSIDLSDNTVSKVA